jgi:uncharacterized protein
MVVKLRKPILVSGVGVSFGLWLWWNIQDSFFEMGEFGVLAAMALGGGFWLLKQKPLSLVLSPSAIAPVTKERVETAIAQANAMLEVLQAEAPEREISPLKQAVTRLPELCDRQTLQIAITGGKNAGKTSLKQLLAASEIVSPLTGVTWVEIPALFASTAVAETAAIEVAFASDVVLFAVAGDLTDSELQIVQQLRASNQRVLVVFNKQDCYIPEERIAILQQLRQRVAGIVESEDVVAIAAAPIPMKVRQYQEDGSVQEWMEAQEPALQAIRDRLSSILPRERESLVWATTWREAMRLKAKTKEILNEARRDRALPIIEQYQWIAAAAAFANPVAALDLLATAAISAQLLVDLSAIYPQKFSLSQAQTASGTIGQLMVKLGIVELSTQAIGSILKSNAVTYIAGGAVQGVSAAYLTHLAGLSLIEYFQEQEISAISGEELNRDRLGKTLQRVFQQNQRAAFLQGFVKQAIARLSLESKQVEIVRN